MSHSVLKYIIYHRIRKYRNEFHIFRNYSLLHTLWNVQLLDMTLKKDDIEVLFTIRDCIQQLIMLDSDQHFINKIRSERPCVLNGKMREKIFMFIQTIKAQYQREYWSILQDFELYDYYHSRQSNCNNINYQYNEN